MDIVYRPAEKADSQRVAELISLASDGVVDFLFHDLVPDMTPNQVVAHNLAQDRYPHSYRSAVVALNGEEVVGMTLSYPSSYHQITDEMRHFFPAERLEHLAGVFKCGSGWQKSAVLMAPFPPEGHSAHSGTIELLFAGHGMAGGFNRTCKTAAAYQI